MFVRITSNLARTWTLSKFCFSSLPPLMSASCTQCVAILYNTVGGESFSERTSGPFSKDALHAQVWDKNAVITGRAFVANDDRPARDVHLDTSINGQNHVLSLRIAYKSWLVSAWRCYLSDASTNEFFMINNYLGCVSVAIMVATPPILLWIISAVTPQPATLPIQSKLLHKPLFDGKGKRLIT